MRIQLLFSGSSDPSSSDFKLEIPDLPHGLEGARHILDLEQLKWALWAMAALILLFLAYRLIRRLRRFAPPPPAPRSEVVPAPVALPEITQRIVSLRDRHLVEGTFRQGCHELAELLRGFYEGLWREPMATRTVREIQIVSERRTGADEGGAPGRLFGLLEGLQFSRRQPREDDFASVCDLAADVTSVHAPARSATGTGAS